MTFFEKLTLLKQLECKGARSSYTQSFSHPDLFGNDTSLRIRLEDSLIECDWLLDNHKYRTIHLSLTEQGRTKVAKSEGFEPPVKTVSQALELIQKSISNMSKTPNTKIKPS